MPGPTAPHPRRCRPSRRGPCRHRCEPRGRWRLAVRPARACSWSGSPRLRGGVFGCAMPDRPARRAMPRRWERRSSTRRRPPDPAPAWTAGRRWWSSASRRQRSGRRRGQRGRGGLEPLTRPVPPRRSRRRRRRGRTRPAYRNRGRRHRSRSPPGATGPCRWPFGRSSTDRIGGRPWPRRSKGCDPSSASPVVHCSRHLSDPFGLAHPLAPPSRQRPST